MLERPNKASFVAPTSSLRAAAAQLLHRAPNEIFSLVSQHMNGDWKATAVYVPIARLSGQPRSTRLLN